MNNIEFETKVLNIDMENIQSLLENIGAKLISNSLTRRKIFDIKSENIEWVRVREIGKKTTLTYKNKPRNSTQVGSTVEIEVEVSDFDKTCELVSKLHFYYRTMYQENKEIIYSKEGIEYKIAIWPMLQPYLEIEGDSKESLDIALDQLGLKGKDSGDYDIARLYQDIGIEMNSYEVLKF